MSQTLSVNPGIEAALVNARSRSRLIEAALLKDRERGPKERLVSLVMDEPGEADAPYCSPVFSNRTLVGLTVSSGYGHAVGKAIALAYVRADLAKAGTSMEVEVLGRRVGTRVEAEPLYDPGNARLRG